MPVDDVRRGVRSRLAQVGCGRCGRAMARRSTAVDSSPRRTDVPLYRCANMPGQQQNFYSSDGYSDLSSSGDNFAKGMHQSIPILAQSEEKRTMRFLVCQASLPTRELTSQITIFCSSHCSRQCQIFS
ncbi:hypothetical protein BRADI_1g44611v3 [Brachypodium distachyon]|uniref:Uncharacterized protein n=1 Tax=Brachypodium distachyon TaxID=15368 RepID=A0A0Q3H749_BRADI|nr:hypothetical protein BRADI_1g44611v3 [Brachypodium distachyon]